ncbi:MAG: helix-turn-helix domain-containing protein [Planctomycetota bacterium]
MAHEASLFVAVTRPPVPAASTARSQSLSPSEPPPTGNAVPTAPGTGTVAAETAGVPEPGEANPATAVPVVPTPLLTEREAADVLAICPRTLWDLRVRGEIPHIRLGRAVRYDASDLHTWIQSQKQHG